MCTSIHSTLHQITLPIKYHDNQIILDICMNFTTLWDDPPRRPRTKTQTNHLILSVQVDLFDDPVGHDSASPVEEEGEALRSSLLHGERVAAGCDGQTVQGRLIADVLLVRIATELIQKDPAARRVSSHNTISLFGIIQCRQLTTRWHLWGIFGAAKLWQLQLQTVTNSYKQLHTYKHTYTYIYTYVQTHTYIYT